MNKNKKKSGKKMCCIVNCSNTYLTGHKLFNFPNRPHEKELKEKWVQCIKRMNIDGTPWLPTANTVICSDHFIGNKPIRHPNSLAYIPSIFPTVCKKQVVNSNQQDSRYKRFCNRGIVPQSTSVVCIAYTNQGQSNNIVNHVGVQVMLDVSDVKEFSFEYSFFNDNCSSTSITTPNNFILGQKKDVKDQSCGPSSEHYSSCLSCEKCHGFESIKN